MRSTQQRESALLDRGRSLAIVKSSEFERILTPGVRCLATEFTGEETVWCMSLWEIAKQPVTLNSHAAANTQSHVSRITIGFCVFNARAPDMRIGQFEDDEHRSKLRSLIYYFMPREIIVPQPTDTTNALTPETDSAIQISVDPKKCTISRSSHYSIVDNDQIAASYQKYFRPGGSKPTDVHRLVFWPPALVDIFHTAKTAAINAFAQAVKLLQRLKIDNQVLSTKTVSEFSLDANQAKYMTLESSVLEKLEVRK